MSKPLGRLVPGDWEHVEKYPLEVKAIVQTVEKKLRLPLWHRLHDQGREGACVGFALTMMMAILNESQARATKTPPFVRRYNARWLWNEAKRIDEWPDTNPGDDNGTSVRAGCDVLRAIGHVRIIRKIERQADIAEGIKTNRWATTIDELRTVISEGTPATLGINWYSNFDHPIRRGSEFWIGQTQNLGHIRGGHAICVVGASDKRQAFRLKNSWGTEYPLVWIPYGVVNRLIREDGEATLVTDR